MKNFYIHKLTLIALIILNFTAQCMAQSKLIINGGYVNISNNAYLVVDNPSPNAISRISGHIISEGELNRIKWNMGSNTGTYTIPWGYNNTHYIPVSFTKTTGTGNGSFLCSTYHTSTWQNSLFLPSGVTNLQNAAGNSDNSAYVIDRFWMIDATGYTIKPDLSDLTFTYIDSEHAIASNTISESNLKAQRFNSSLNKWGDFLPAGTVSLASNTVVVPIVLNSDLFRTWTLVDQSQPLPVSLISFNGNCENGEIQLTWQTASEENNDYFTCERSTNGSDWIPLAQIMGAGNSSQLQNYAFTDLAPSQFSNFYRLKQTDYNGNSTFSEIISVASCRKKDSYSVFPNPAGNFIQITSNHSEEKTQCHIYNQIGQEMHSEMFSTNESLTRRIDTSKLPSGIYNIIIQSGINQSVLPLIIQH